MAHIDSTNSITSTADAGCKKPSPISKLLQGKGTRKGKTWTDLNTWIAQKDERRSWAWEEREKGERLTLHILVVTDNSLHAPGIASPCYETVNIFINQCWSISINNLLNCCNPGLPVSQVTSYVTFLDQCLIIRVDLMRDLKMHHNWSLLFNVINLESVYSEYPFKVVYHRCWSLIFETKIQYILIGRQSFLAGCRALNQGVNWTHSLGATRWPI